MRKKGWLQLLAVLALAAFMALFAAGCGDDSPGDVVKEALEKTSDRDFGDVYDLFSRDSSLRKQSKDEYVADAEKDMPEEASIEDIEILEEKIDGDKATVKFKATFKTPGEPDDTDENTAKLVKEDGEWKIVK